MDPTFVPLPQSYYQRRYEEIRGFKVILSPPSASHIMWSDRYRENHYIMDGSNLSTQVGTALPSASSIYTHSSMNSRIMVCQAGTTSYLPRIKVLIPDPEKPGYLSFQSSIPLSRNPEDDRLTIFGGSVLMSRGPASIRNFYEIDIDLLGDITSTKEFLTHDRQGNMECNDSFIIPLSSRVHLAGLYNKESIDVLDFRDTSTRGESASIPIKDSTNAEMGFKGGIKAASRAFLQGNASNKHLACLDQGTLVRTRMTCTNFLDSFYAFSDVFPTIAHFNINNFRVRLFDVKREQLKSDFSSGCCSLRTLFVDGMPQLVGIERETGKLGILL